VLIVKVFLDVFRSMIVSVLHLLCDYLIFSSISLLWIVSSMGQVFSSLSCVYSVNMVLGTVLGI
jgi:hypothetical protein